MIIGVMEDMTFTTQKQRISEDARLFVICDGCYEIRDASGEMADYNTFETFMLANASEPDPLEALENWALEKQGASTLDDDFSIMEIQFPA
jgi:serine phosphatase RsbU (regulator of sigma subunit)